MSRAAPKPASRDEPRRELREALTRAPLFAALPEEHRQRLARAARIVTLGAQQRLWNAGARATHLGLVLAGRLKLTRSEARRDTILDVAGPGDVLGEVAFTLGASYQSDAVCLRRARVALVPSRLLRAMLEAEPRAATGLALELAGQVLRLMRQVQALSAGSVEQRLARVLLGLAERAGEPFPGGVLVPLRLRRMDLASLAATTLESTSRRLSQWSKLGWVVPQPAGYLLKNLDALRALADSR